MGSNIRGGPGIYCRIVAYASSSIPSSTKVSNCVGCLWHNEGRGLDCFADKLGHKVTCLSRDGTTGPPAIFLLLTGKCLVYQNQYMNFRKRLGYCTSNALQRHRHLSWAVASILLILLDIQGRNYNMVHGFWSRMHVFQSAILEESTKGGIILISLLEVELVVFPV